MSFVEWAREAGDGLVAGLPSNRFDGPLARREATPAESSGRRILNRAAATIIVGGLIIGGISLAFSGSLLAADVRILGLFIGIVMVGVGATSVIEPGSRKLVQGVIVIALSIVAMPVALGGYVIGSLVGIVGGAMLVGYEPPTTAMTVRTEPAGYPRRAVALLVDFMIAFLVQRILYLFMGWFFTNTLNVILTWIVVWFVAVIEPSILFRRTAGRLLVSTRVIDADDGGRPPAGNAAIRELLRGAVAIGGLFLVAGATLQTSLNLGRGIAMILVLGALVALAEGFGLLDRVSQTTVGHDRILPVAGTTPGAPTVDKTTEMPTIVPADADQVEAAEAQAAEAQAEVADAEVADAAEADAPVAETETETAAAAAETGEVAGSSDALPPADDET